MKATTYSKKVTLPMMLGTGLGITLLFIALYYIGEDVRYFGLDPEVLGRFGAIKWWLVGHLSGGIVAILIGPFQFWSRFRNRNIKLHRNLGKAYIIAILIGSVSSTFMAWTSALAVHWTWAFSLQMLAVVWLSTVLMAYRTIRQKRIQQHKQWMIRSYIVTFGFVLFRVFNDTATAFEWSNFIERAPTIVWCGWAIPLFFLEIYFQWNED